MFPVQNQSSHQVDVDSLENHATELNCLASNNFINSGCEYINMPVFSENLNEVNPERTQSNESLENNEFYRGPQRKPIPVAIIDWQNRNDTQFIAMNGLDFLNTIDSLYVQQTIELNELHMSGDSEKRYIIKKGEGEAIYYAAERSSSFQRLCFGSRRYFEMTLYDRTQQKAFELRRRLACGACSFWCYLQVLEVWSAEEALLGSVKQEMSFGFPCFTVRDSYDNILYRIEGHNNTCSCNYATEAHFKVYSADGMTQQGSINHHWDQVQVDYILGIQFPSPNTHKTKKALLLGAVFLLEYIFFEVSRSGRCRCLC